MRLRKYHGLGNDFLILFDLDGAQAIDAATAAGVCDRHRGVGADGLIRVTAGSEGSDVTMELRNADGGRAETSGNGLRCVARAVVDAGLRAGPGLVISTDVGARRATVGADGCVSVEMGVVETVDRDGQWDDLGPKNAGWSGFADAGNPHAVFGVDDPAKIDLVADGEAWDRHYPGGTNVEYVAVGPEPDGLTMRVWERGVGETLSCGSGACAAAVVARGLHLVGERVTVHQPGGDLVVDLSGDTVVLTGPAEYVCRVETP
ncbi:MAG: diaminopimelate epimerase [Actinomycetota bacterium]|nr:diaminopimelate epimerase [Actinomycetota bacterium]